MQPVQRTVRKMLRADLWLSQAQRLQPSGRQIVSAIMIIVVVVAAIAVSAIPQATYAANTNVLANGNFESGFSSRDGCGMVGNQWNCFTNGGDVNYGFHDDQWAPVLADGSHAQLIAMDTNGISEPSNDRYAGIYQTVRAVNGADYMLNLRGMIRSTKVDGDPYRYVVQVGWTLGPQPNWAAVTNWQDTGWYTYHERENPGNLSEFSTNIRAEYDYITLYVRVWQKWGIPDQELNVNLDAITLTGLAPGSAVVLPGTGGPVTTTPIGGGVLGAGQSAVTLPAVVQPGQATCFNTEFLYNGSFELGFNPVSVGNVGKGWGYFTNGGRANFGFFNDQWAPVVADGASAQLISINTTNVSPADGDRFAGIYQHIGRLTPGQTYELTVRGLLRGTGDSTDAYRFEGQWGFNAFGDTDWTKVSNWQGMDLGSIGDNTNPGPIGTYRVRFVAPSSSIVLFLRGWMKWPALNQEMNFNVDAISLKGCGGGTVTPPQACSYIVRPGDTLARIAAMYNTSVAQLVAWNGIRNPNIIFVGQTLLVVPNCGGPVINPPPITPPIGQPQFYKVRAGDTLSGIARSYGVTTAALAACNGITNWNLIFVGQILKIP